MGRAEHRAPASSRNACGVVRGAPGARIDGGEDVLMDVRRGVHEADAVGTALQEPEVAVASRMHERRDGPAVALDVEHQRRIRLVPVPRAVVVVLVVPGDRPGRGVEGQDRVRVEVVARPRVAHPRAGIAGAPVDLIQRGVVGRGHPHRRAARAPRLAGPRLAARLAGCGDGVRLPDLAAGVGIERDDETTNAEPAAGHADHDLPVDGERRHRDVVADGRVRDPALPNDRPGHRVQRDDRGVDSTDEDLVAVQGDTAIHLVAVLAGIRRQVPDVAPLQIAGRRLEREHLQAPGIQRGGDEHVPVVDDGRRLVVPVRAGGEGPHRIEGGDVRPRDPTERAVSPAVVRAAVHRPVARLGVQKPLGGHRGIVGIGREGCCGPRGRTVNGDSHEEGWQDQPQGWNQAVPRPRRHRSEKHQRGRRSRGWFLLQAAAIESMVLVSRIRNATWGVERRRCRASRLEVSVYLSGRARRHRPKSAGGSEDGVVPTMRRRKHARADRSDDPCRMLRRPSHDAYGAWTFP